MMNNGPQDITRAELVALREAVDECIKLHKEEEEEGLEWAKDEWFIFSDSAAAIGALDAFQQNPHSTLDNPYHQTCVRIAKRIAEAGVKIVICKVAAHAEIEGNEKADFLANEARKDAEEAEKEGEELEVGVATGAHNTIPVEGVTDYPEYVQLIRSEAVTEQGTGEEFTDITTVFQLSEISRILRRNNWFSEGTPSEWRGKVRVRPADTEATLLPLPAKIARGIANKATQMGKTHFKSLHKAIATQTTLGRARQPSVKERRAGAQPVPFNPNCPLCGAELDTWAHPPLRCRHPIIHCMQCARHHDGVRLLIDEVLRSGKNAASYIVADLAGYREADTPRIHEIRISRKDNFTYDTQDSGEETSDQEARTVEALERLRQRINESESESEEEESQAQESEMEDSGEEECQKSKTKGCTKAKAVDSSEDEDYETEGESVDTSLDESENTEEEQDNYNRRRRERELKSMEEEEEEAMKEAEPELEDYMEILRREEMTEEDIQELEAELYEQEGIHQDIGDPLAEEVQETIPEHLTKRIKENREKALEIRARKRDKEENNSNKRNMELDTATVNRIKANREEAIIRRDKQKQKEKEETKREPEAPQEETWSESSEEELEPEAMKGPDSKRGYHYTAGGAKHPKRWNGLPEWVGYRGKGRPDGVIIRGHTWGEPAPVDKTRLHIHVLEFTFTSEMSFRASFRQKRKQHREMMRGLKALGYKCTLHILPMGVRGLMFKHTWKELEALLVGIPPARRKSLYQKLSHLAIRRLVNIYWTRRRLEVGKVPSYKNRAGPAPQGAVPLAHESQYASFREEARAKNAGSTRDTMRRRPPRG
jgi:hypothetical protein